MVKAQQHVWVMELRYGSKDPWFPHTKINRGVVAFESKPPNMVADMYKQEMLYGKRNARIIKYVRAEAKRG